MHRRSMKTRFYFGAGCILFVFCGVFSLLGLFVLLFNRTLVTDLKGVMTRFKTISGFSAGPL